MTTPHPGTSQDGTHPLPTTTAAPVLDRIVAAVGLLLLLPVFGLIALLIKIESPGPIFYRQERVGKDGRRFWLYKFRKMPHGPDRGPKISPPNDLRLTRVGRILERLKLDELPQLLNVIRGEMRIIGPRPEVPEIVEQYTASQRKVLAAWPGITGPNQIIWRNEKDLIPSDVDDVEGYYVRFILPQKIDTDLNYLKHRTPLTDLLLLAQTVWVTIGEPLKPQHIERQLNHLAHVGADAVLLSLSFMAAILVQAETLVPAGSHVKISHVLSAGAVLVGGQMVGFLALGVCRQSWKLISKADLLTIIKTLTLTTVAVVPILALWLPAPVLARTAVLEYSFAIHFVGGARFLISVREEYRETRRHQRRPKRKAVIYGVNKESELFLRRVEANLEPFIRILCFLDSDPSKRGMRIHNVAVLGSAADLRLLHELQTVNDVFVFADHSDPGYEQLKRLCSELGIRFHERLGKRGPSTQGRDESLFPAPRLERQKPREVVPTSEQSGSVK